MDPALAEFERNRREYINAMKRIRLENPDINPIELEMRAREEITSKGPKSRAYYRLQASRKLAGKGLKIIRLILLSTSSRGSL